MITADIHLAYNLVLARDPDPEGLQYYSRLVAQGMSFKELVQDLLSSPEYRGGEAQPPKSSDQQTDRGTITPADLLGRYSVDQLIDTADEYYRSIADPTAIMRRPFAFLHEAPIMLQNLGALLGGLQLGKTMTVLEFGAGTCWLSRYLAQLDCRPICCDVSPAALEIGRRLFREHPPIGPTLFEPIFLPFDGHRLDLEDESVDRVVCFDALHHVPNVADVIGEMGRVLRKGGIAGFSEPGLGHSRSAQSQYEMRDHRVLENDIDLRGIDEAARAAGFTQLSVRAANDLEVSLEDYDAIVERRGGNVQRAVWNATSDAMRARLVFFLRKGETRHDSRSHAGLAHAIQSAQAECRVAPGAPLRVDLHIDNVGTAAWLATNIHEAGIVRVGTHLYDDRASLLAIDHSRHDLPHDVEPGDSVDLTIAVPLPPEGDYVVGIDLVAERVIWFEHIGSKIVVVRARRS